ncbi:hypothetical protein KK141_01040 [Dyella sp. LX-66]|uniref:YcxB family protein n=1 Tax=unclassified Dyella TaxID=2634549 RepID=UPI001BE0F2AB|nr:MULTISPECIES: YcxB family protein [unclassified Dyella]MBT2116102.1 hypothetical protein [Dyella sp. LX-1]MBT2138112.1 hypothetical protein [Dyella sp. LX-66]
MTEFISITPVRTYGDTFSAVAQIWLTTPSSRWGMVVMFALIAGVNAWSGPWWMAIVGGALWLLLIVPLAIALQSWNILRSARREGPSTFAFGEEGVVCRSKTMEARVLWSGMVRVLLTKQHCFLYFTPRFAWFLRRDGMSSSEEIAILKLASDAGVKVQGVR